MHGDGHHDIEALIEGVQTRFPDFRFALSARPADGFHDQLRFSWDLGPEGGDAVVQGTDFAVLAGDGRLRSVTGFLDRVPAGAGSDYRGPARTALATIAAAASTQSGSTVA